VAERLARRYDKLSGSALEIISRARLPARSSIHQFTTHKKEDNYQ
jgi:hypothetical protein